MASSLKAALILREKVVESKTYGLYILFRYQKVLVNIYTDMKIQKKQIKFPGAFGIQ